MEKYVIINPKIKARSNIYISQNAEFGTNGPAQLSFL